MERPIHTPEFIIAVTGNDLTLVSYIHHGSVETPISGQYPFLDSKETLGFEAPSWKLRWIGSKPFLDAVEEEDLYGIFSQAYREGMRWFNRYKDSIPDALMPLYDKLNPFEGKDLKARLEAAEKADPEAKKTLIEKLKKPVDRYPLTKTVQEYADEISDLFLTYTTTYETLR